MLPTNLHQFLVKPHQEREEYAQKLQEQVNERDALIRKLARELKTIETALVEATFQVKFGNLKTFWVTLSYLELTLSYLELNFR